MARSYIHERTDLPRFTWDSKGLAPLLSAMLSRVRSINCVYLAREVRRSL
jgi:hypothetical protein